MDRARPEARFDGMEDVKELEPTKAMVAARLAIEEVAAFDVAAPARSSERVLLRAIFMVQCFLWRLSDVAIKKEDREDPATALKIIGKHPQTH